MNRKLFPKLYVALNFCFFCFKTKDKEKTFKRYYSNEIIASV